MGAGRERSRLPAGSSWVWETPCKVRLRWFHRGKRLVRSAAEQTRPKAGWAEKFQLEDLNIDLLRRKWDIKGSLGGRSQPVLLKMKGCEFALEYENRALTTTGN